MSTVIELIEAGERQLAEGDAGFGQLPFAGLDQFNDGGHDGPHARHCVSSLPPRGRELA